MAVTLTTAACVVAAQAAVYAYLNVEDAPPFCGQQFSIVLVDRWTFYDEVPSGVVIEHEGGLLPHATEAARRAVAAQGLRLDTERFRYAWEVLCGR